MFLYTREKVIPHFDIVQKVTYEGIVAGTKITPCNCLTCKKMRACTERGWPCWDQEYVTEYRVTDAENFGAKIIGNLFVLMNENLITLLVI